MPRPLLFVGAGGLGREALAAVRAAADPRWAPLGFLDDNVALVGKMYDGLPVLGLTGDVDLFPEAALVLCVASAADPGGRRALADRLDLHPDRYACVVHPAASIADGTAFGPGGIFLAGTTITAPQRVGAHVVAMPHVVLTHDDHVGDFVTLATGVKLSGFVTVDQTAYLGAGSMVRQLVRIGAGAVVGMGAVVLNDIAPFEVWAGNPARRLYDPKVAA